MIVSFITQLINAEKKTKIANNNLRPILFFNTVYSVDLMASLLFNLIADTNFIEKKKFKVTN